MEEREHADGQGDDNRKRREGQDPQDDIDLGLVGGERVEDVELVCSRAGQLHLRPHQDPRVLLAGGGADGNRLPLGVSPRHGGAHLRGYEGAHLLVLDLVDAQRGRGSIRAQEGDVGRSGSRGRGFDRRQRAARGLLDLVRGGGGGGGEGGLRGGETQGGVREDRVLARVEHQGAQLGGDDHPEDEENGERGEGDRQGEPGGEGMAYAMGQVRGGEHPPRPRLGYRAREAPRRAATLRRRHGTQPRERSRPARAFRGHVRSSSAGAGRER